METDDDGLDDFSETAASKKGEIIELKAPPAPKTPLPQLTKDELDTLVEAIKKMTTVFALNDNDWTDAASATIRLWLENVNYLILTIFYDGDELTACLAFPLAPVYDLTYFVRNVDQTFTVDNFHDTVNFGTIHEDIDGSLLRILTTLYAPMFFSMKQLSENVKGKFFAALNNFLTYLAGLHYKMSGLTVLYIPSEGLMVKQTSAVRDRELVKRLETIAVHWIASIRTCLSDKEQLVPHTLMCPPDQFDFFAYRHEVLHALQLQMKHKDFLKIISVLENAQSIFVKQINDLFYEITKELEKVSDNMDFLQILVEPCKDLNSVESPLDVPAKLKKIMHLIRIIWINAKYFNTNEDITGLFRTLSNQIIIFCQNKINVDEVLNGKPRLGIKIANMAIDCCLAYRIIYDDVRAIHEARKHTLGWDLEEPAIFNHVDAFVQRLEDLIEICNALIVFGRTDETAGIPRPLFGGIRGKEFESTCQIIEDRFKKALHDIQNVASHILDVHNSEWFNDVTKYRKLIKDLEEIVENLISNVFLSVANVAAGIEALCSLYYYSARKNLRPAYIRKTSEVWLMFAADIDVVNKQLMGQINERPSWLPNYAGRAIILKTNLDRITRLKLMFDKAEWLPDNPNSFKTISAYEQMNKNITKTIKDLNDTWLDTVPTNVLKKLDRTLMCRSVTRPGLLECNIDRSIMDICEETRHFEMLGFGVPVHINQIYAKYNTIRFVYESVLTVVLDYNKMLGALSDKERILFKALIKSCERKIMPGIYKLTWGSDSIDQYVQDCVKETGQLQEFVDVYKKANLSIVQTCENICDTPIIRINNISEAVTLKNLIDVVKEERKLNMMKLLGYFNDIVSMIVVVYEGFQAQIDNMAHEWIEYIRKLDNLLQEALKACAKNSMHTFFTILHGSGTIGPSPLIEIKIDLEDNKLNFTPSISDVSQFLGNIPNMFISTFKHFPRLFEKFQLPMDGDMQPFHYIIEHDTDFHRLQNDIAEEIDFYTHQMVEYVSVWSPFSSIWELDENEFLAKYKASKADASVFDMDINIYIETANQVQLQESKTTVYFVDVNAMGLKNAVLLRIEDWKDKLKQLLKTNAYERIQELYDYTTTNVDIAMRVPKTIPEMQQAITFYDHFCFELPAKVEEFPSIQNYFVVLDKHEVTLSSGMRQMNNNIEVQWSWYLQKLKEAAEMLDNSKDTFKLNLLEEAETLKDEAKKLFDSFNTLPTGENTSPKEAKEALRKMRAQLQLLYDQEQRILNDLGVFNINIPENLDLRNLDKQLKELEEVWDLADQWEDAWTSYKSGSFWDIRTDEMEECADSLYKQLNRLSKQLKYKNWEILEKTKTDVDEFRKTLPLLVALKNPSMRERHWDRVQKVVQVDFDEKEPEFNLESVIKMKFQKYAEEIMDISYASTMELQIENGIKNIREVWDGIQIEMIIHKEDIFRVKNVDDCFVALEDNAVQISSMKSTRFVEPFSKEVDYWEKTLNYIFETLESCLVVQRQWLYLENIFLGDDIRKQLPEEAKNFVNITNEWTDITSNMNAARNALEATHYEPPNYLFDKLQSMTGKLELIERALEIYLETKRQLFPRFYFISNDDMLEILGNAKKPDVVQPHMRKLFDNIYKCKLVRNTVGKVLRWEANGMISDDGEYVPFLEIIILAGPSEKWLSVIEHAMRVTLKDQLRLTRKSLKKLISQRDKWLAMWPGQLCLTSSKIQWTTDCTKNLTICKLVNQKKPLKKLRKKQNTVLMKWSEMSRKDLGKQLRLKVNTVITIEIHGRDVIDRMYKMSKYY